MTFASLLRANLLRNPVRTSLTAMCLILAFMLFGLLQPLNKIFTQGPELGSVGRLVVLPKHSTSDLLPVSYLNRISELPAITAVTHVSWFGGTYVDPANFFPQFAVDPRLYLQVFTEIQLPPAQRDAFMQQRNGAIVGRDTAQRFGWQVGDVIPLIPNIWHNRDGGPWEFELVGIFTSADEGVVNNTGFYFGFDYFDNYRAFGQGLVGSYVARISSAQQVTDTATRIDDLFANSDAETKTLSDREYALSFARQLGNIGLIIDAILLAVFFTILLLSGHTLAQSARERIAELAVMRVLGFQVSATLSMMMAEAVLLTIGAAALGLLLAEAMLLQLNEIVPQLKQIGSLGVPLGVAALGLLLALGLAVLVGLPPAIMAVRRSIVDALRV